MSVAYRYTVTDRKENKIVLKNVLSPKVCETIGIGQNNLNKYVTDKIAYRGRYLITRKENPVKSKAREYKEDEKRIMEEWDRVRILLNPKAKGSS